jgi:hypothetical protein
MRLLLIAIFAFCVPLAIRGETLREWVDAAPHADISFTPWDGDFPSVNSNRQGYPNLPQGLYGYLDLSRLPVDVFPIEVRLIYDAPTSEDAVVSVPGTPTEMKDTDPVGSGSVVEKIVISTAAEAHSIPVWNSPLPLRHEDFSYPGESARAEIRSSTGTLVGRLPIGASAPLIVRPRAVLVNTPAAHQAFSNGNYNYLAEVKRLIPDSYAFARVDTIWIDAATAADTRLSDAFWQQVLLGGTTVAGNPADIGLLEKRLNLNPNEPVLLGGLVAADSPETFILDQGRLVATSSAALINVKDSPFFFSIQLGEAMHRELLRYSEYYLGIFVILQVTVIVVAFRRLRGTRRVWLWLVVPGSAVAYTLAGIALAHLAVRARSDGGLSQVELRREGWPQSVVLANFQEINLADQETVLQLPVDSRPFIPSPNYYSVANWAATFLFSHDSGTGQLTIHTQPATRVEANVRSVYNSIQPFEIASDGTLKPRQVFSDAWFWDGANWRSLGQILPNTNVDWKTAPFVHPSLASSDRLFWDGRQEDNFPSVLKPLLSDATLRALSAAGDGLFLGVQSVEDRWSPSATRVQVQPCPNDRISSRHVIAYQFHLNGGTP